VVRYSNAGHQPGPRCLSAAGCLTSFDLPGNPAGLLDEPSFEETESILGPGDRLFLCTDGLVEAMNDQRESFGADRLDQWLADHAHAGSEQLADGIIVAVQKHACADRRLDDISILIISAKKEEGIPEISG
ncbi:MAG: serine/threonine-protein phosphatase, partial [Deltaproteobacteria bacterium]|nr:serine/threonine-protein phosphatase [Deltaproteobacteria bacterium]